MIFEQYLWFVVVGGFLSFFMSWGIGANDVANSFATSIGAKTLTLFQACCIAACLEFLGAITLGGEVSKTISSSIAKPDVFVGASEIYAYGMLCSLLSASLWVSLASRYGYAVSTTHSIIGSVIGFTLVWGGNNAIIWVQRTDDFPYVKGLVPVIISWFTSPFMSSILAAIIFLANRHLVLRRRDSNKIVYFALPPLVFITIFINLFFILYKGAKAELAWDASKAAWVSVIVASGCSLISGIAGIPFLRWKIRQKEAQTHNGVSDIVLHDNNLMNIISIGNAPNPIMIVEEQQEQNTKVAGTKKTFMKVFSDKDANDIEMHGGSHSAEVFAEDTEYVYKYLQVFSSCSVAFAHGANDVANSIGPYAAIWYVYNNAEVSNNVGVPKWMLALGGAGIVIGLWTYGWNVIKSLGGQLCALTPSRGYSAELATALTVSFASVYGIPISTTHCIVGAEIGIGLVENIKTGVNWRLFGKTFTAWVFTLIVSGLLSAALFAQGVYSPSVMMLVDLNSYENNIKNMVYDCNASMVNDSVFISIIASDNIKPDALLSVANETCMK
jgi:sodium-dependent phosphate transporter